jgi:hypothetical protein
LSTLFPPLRQVAPPAQKFVDERPLLLEKVPYDKWLQKRVTLSRIIVRPSGD